MRFQAAVLHAPNQLLELLALRLRQQGDTRALDGGVAHLEDIRLADVREQADAPGGRDVEIPADSHLNDLIGRRPGSK